MFKAILAIAALIGLGWAAYDRLEIGERSPGGPSVPYPAVEQQSGDGIEGVGGGTKGLLGD